MSPSRVRTEVELVCKSCKAQLIGTVDDDSGNPESFTHESFHDNESDVHVEPYVNVTIEAVLHNKMSNK